MKKFYFILAVAFSSVAANSASPHKAPAMITESPAQEEASDWQTIGECAYTDDLATTFWSVGPQTYNVTVQSDALHPGMYRIINPWKNYPAPERAAIENHEDYPGELLCSDDYYILIDATDPDKVKIKPSPIGIVYKPKKMNHEVQPPVQTQDYRVCTAYGKSELIGKYNISAEAADKACGTLIDGVITFPQRQAIYIISENAAEDLDWHIGDKFGAFSLNLNGTTVPVNYDFSVVTKTAYCPSEAGNYQFYVVGDENIPVLRYAVVYEWPDHPIAAEECIQTGKNIRPDQVTVVSTKGMPTRCAHVYIMAADQEGTIKKAQYFEVFNPEFEAEEWEHFSGGTMTEGFLSSLYPTLFKPLEYAVEIEKHKTRADYYRVVNPYQNNPETEQYLTYGHGHDHHLYINATDPDNVYIERSTLGLEVLESELYVGHDWADLLWMWGSDDYESDKNFFEMYYGVSSSGATFKDGVLTFAPSAGLYLSLSGGALYDTNVAVNPDFDYEAYQSAVANGTEYDVAPYLPGNFKLVINKIANGDDGDNGDDEDGIDDVRSDSSSLIYDLQGRRISNPSAPGLYIINGKKTLK